MSDQAKYKLDAKMLKGPLPVGKLYDARGLFLKTDVSGSRWILRFTLRGKQVEMGLGSLADVPLKRAREKADKARGLIADGVDPRVARDGGNKRVTFLQATEALIKNLENDWRNEKHKWQWRQTLDTYARPLHKIPVGQITTQDIVAVLRPLWDEKHETANRLRGRIERVLDYSRANGWTTGENPGRWRGGLRELMPKRRELVRGHHAAMRREDVPDFFAGLLDNLTPSAVALRLLIATATRTSEVLAAEWGEVDLEAKLWSIPGARTKTGKGLRVPLNEAALGALHDASTFRRDQLGPWIFPSRLKPNKHLSNMSMLQLLRRRSLGHLTAHGFRSTFRDWASEVAQAHPDVAELALGHEIGSKVSRAYQRGDALDARRVLMAQWSDFIASKCQ